VTKDPNVLPQLKCFFGGWGGEGAERYNTAWPFEVSLAVLGISASKECGHYFTVIGFRPLLRVTDLEMPLMFVVLSVTVCNTTSSMSEQVLEYTQQADVQCLLLLQLHIRYFKYFVTIEKQIHTTGGRTALELNVSPAMNM